MIDENVKKANLHTIVIREAKEMLVIFLFLALFFCTFSMYRRLILDEIGISYYHYGFAVLKSLVLAKVILLGQHVRIGKLFDDRPLYIPTIYKVILFSLFVAAFEVLEHVIGALVHGKAITAAFQEIISIGRDELIARTLMMLFAFLPFFAFTEMGRRLGEGRLYTMFFVKTKTTKDI